MITERQEQILNTIIQEYIDSAQPVSSQLLEKKYNFGICPATIRIEMQKLTNQGYLCQPHTSAGRIPTDKGYRFFVDNLLKKGVEDLENLEIDLENIQAITKFLASESSNLVSGYLASEKILWKEGWSEILKNPEFEEYDYALRFAQLLEDFEKKFEKLFSDKIQIYIGKNPISKVKDFSIITSGFSDGFFAILGPKRMSYSKNISLLNKICRKKSKKKI